MTRLTANVPISNATFSNLSDLSQDLTAGQKYVGRLVVKCNNTAPGEGVKFDFAGGSATMTSFWAVASELAGDGTVLGEEISTSLAGVINYNTITGETLIEIEISMVVNAGGTFIPRFAENSTDTGTVTAELGSYLSLAVSSN